jgi:50S ribosomal protein L16 3-hydroxylase
MTTPLLGGLSVERFLAEHWQKRPLLVRGAFPAWRAAPEGAPDGEGPPLSADELAGLACEHEVESRLVRRGAALAAGEPAFALEHGPFDERRFAALPERDWTLLVQDVDKQAPEFAALLDPFRFIPDWRIDDLMVSYATDGGGVGPHVDQYDVFLVQGLGRRRWRIGRADADLAERDGIELGVLARFEPTDEWLLEPGDLLYLPPGVPHDGVAVGECMTFSIGFRAPSARELHSDLAELLYQRLPEAARYADPDLAAADPAVRGQIDAAALARIRATVRAGFAASDAELDAWFARFVTEPKPQLGPEPPDQPLDPETLAAELRAGATLRRDPRSRLAWVAGPGDDLVLAADGAAHPLPASLRGLAVLLCAERTLPTTALRRYLDDPVARALLAELHAQGCLDLD